MSCLHFIFSFHAEHLYLPFILSIFIHQTHTKGAMRHSLLQRPCTILASLVILYSHFTCSLQIRDETLESRAYSEFKSHCESDSLTPILEENCQEGADPREWEINGAGDPKIQGFAAPFSILPGETVDFRVKTDSQDWRIDIYRIGFYTGKGARLVHSIKNEDILKTTQPACKVDGKTYLVDCINWKISAVWNLSEDVHSGVYFAKIIRNDAVKTWRQDGSQVAPESKFSNPNRDPLVPPPCKDGSANCEAMKDAYGAIRREEGTMLENSIKEPYSSHIYFVVRSLAKTQILVQTLDTTWQAYNSYGAPNTYGVGALKHQIVEFNTHGFAEAVEQAKHDNGGELPSRAFVTSYNRPFITRDIRAVNKVWNSEYPLIRFLESNGYDVGYVSGVDTHLGRFFGSEKNLKNPEKPDIFISIGHDEYWSSDQRTTVEKLRDDFGVNLAFFSGNEMYWNVRWEENAFDKIYEDPSIMPIYKESQSDFKIDPNPDLWTGTFRDPGFREIGEKSINPEGGRPENAVLGVLWTVNAWRNDPLLVPFEFSRHRFWRNTELSRELKENTQTAVLLKGLLGHEWDEDVDNGFRPDGLIHLSRTKVHNTQVIVDHGSMFDSGTATHNLVMYKNQKHGNWVFGAGTVQWSWGLDKYHDQPTGLPNFLENGFSTRINEDLNSSPDQNVMQATVNLFTDMGVLPASLLNTYGLVVEVVEDFVAPVSEVTTVFVDSVGDTVVGFYAEDGAEDGSDGSEGIVAGLEVKCNDDVDHWHPAQRVQSGIYKFVLNECKEILYRAIDDSCNIEKENVQNLVDPKLEFKFDNEDDEDDDFEDFEGEDNGFHYEL